MYGIYLRLLQYFPVVTIIVFFIIVCCGISCLSIYIVCMHIFFFFQKPSTHAYFLYCEAYLNKRMSVRVGKSLLPTITLMFVICSFYLYGGGTHRLSASAFVMISSEVSVEGSVSSLTPQKWFTWRSSGRKL